MICQGRAGCNEPGVPSHQFHESHSVVNAPSFGVRTVKDFHGLLDRSQITKSARYISHVVVDGLGNPHDRKCVPAFFRFLKEVVTTSLGTVATDSKEDVHIPLNEIVYRRRHIDRAARGTQDRSAVVVNRIDQIARQQDRLRPLHRIKAPITVAKSPHFCNPVGAGEFKEEAADHIVQAWTQAPAGYDAGARPLRVEKQFRSRPGKLKQHLIPCGHARVAYDIKGNSCLITDRVSHW
jgi:hypothetical protein